MTEITHDSVTLAWSIGNTHHIDMIQLDQRELDESGSAAGPWSTETYMTRLTSHTVPSLIPGTKYEFYVQIQSYGRTARTDSTTVATAIVNITTVTVTTGETITPGYTCTH